MAHFAPRATFDQRSARKARALAGYASLLLSASCLDFDRYGEAPVVGGAADDFGGAPTGGSAAPGGGAPGGGGGDAGGEGGGPVPDTCGDGVLTANEECDDALGPTGACVACVVVCDGDDELKLGTHCYYRDSNGDSNWQDAKPACNAWRAGAHLAAIEAEEEQVGLAPLFDDTIWLGGQDEDTDGVWTWVTGEVFGYENWDVQQNQPNAGNNERCMGVYGTSTGGTTWHDIDCGLTEKYLCEWEPPLR